MDLEKIAELYDVLSVYPKNAILITTRLELFSLDQIKNRYKAISLFPGRFEPIKGPQQQVYAELLSRPHLGLSTLSALEISIGQVAKRRLSKSRYSSVISQLIGKYNLLLTDCPTFYEKAGLLTGFDRLSFHIGYNTSCSIISDYGVLGCEGINATFYVHPRGKSIFPNGIKEVPNNFLPSALVRVLA